MRWRGLWLLGMVLPLAARPAGPTLQQTLDAINAEFVVVPKGDTTDAIDLEHFDVSADHSTLIFEMNQKLMICCKDRGFVTLRYWAAIKDLNPSTAAGDSYVELTCRGGKACVQERSTYSNGKVEEEDPDASMIIATFARDPAAMARVQAAFQRLFELLQ